MAAPPLPENLTPLPGPDVTEPYAAPAPQYAPSPDEMPPPATAVAPPPGNGQWVYTAQYGWIWMPYGASYTYAAAGAYPDMYVYYPAYGWRWVVAPWVWGIGPRPYFGVYGWARYGWYGRGFGHWYGYRGYPAWAGRGWVRPGGPVVHPVAPYAVRPAPHVVAPRPGVVVTHPGGFARPAPVQAHPGGFARPGAAMTRPGGFARPAPIARPAPVARGGFSGGGHGFARR
jgi:hypothetical protein